MVFQDADLTINLLEGYPKLDNILEEFQSQILANDSELHISNQIILYDNPLSKVLR